MRLTVVGNPGNRRVRMFADAAADAGLPPVVVLPWRSVLADGALPDGDTTVRIDSPGEDAEVDRLLRGADRPARHGEIVGGSRWYAGLVRAVDAIAGTGAALLNQPADIATMFDKRRTHALLDAAGVPVPEALDGVCDHATLRAALRASGMRRVFVKPAHGSSASGVLALATGPGGRISATTSVELADGRLYNSLRIRRYDKESEIATIVDRLGSDGLHVERWFPKARFAGRVIDLRVLVVAGRTRHVVVRSSRSPLTNLHLGNDRGDVAALRAALGEATWTTALDTCARVAACFPDTLHVGVDLMLGHDRRRHAIAEVNAFGDLLPGLRVDGRDSYAEEIDALIAGRFTPRPAGTAVPACAP